MKIKNARIVLGITFLVACAAPETTPKRYEIICYGEVIDTAQGIPYASKTDTYVYYGREGTERVPINVCQFRSLP